MGYGERIKLLRKELSLSQEAFGEKLGVGKTAVSKIEKEENSLTERNVILICETFNVNECWLRTGTGDIFRKLTLEEEISSYLGKLLSGSNVNADFQKRFIKALLRLRIEDWEVLERFCDMLMEEKKGQE